MRIHYTGTEWQGATSTNIKQELESLRHEVAFFDYRPPRKVRMLQNIVLRLSRRQEEARYGFHKKRSEEWLASVTASRPDLILIEDAPTILAEYVSRASALKVPIYCYVVSPPYSTVGGEVFLNFAHADEVFCIDREWMHYINYFYPRTLHHLPLAGSEHDFHPIAGGKKRYDAVFVGSAPGQTPDGLLRAKLAAGIPERFRVGVFGSGWRYWTRYFPILEKRIDPGGPPDAKRVNEIYNQAKIMVNFHSTGHTTSISSRTFEIALSGGFQVVDPRDDLFTLFPRNSFPLFRTPDELNRAIEHWVRRDAERDARAARAREHALAHHTWRHRAEAFLRCMKQ